MSLSRAFGQYPDRKRKALFDDLRNYQKGQFQNLTDTPALTKGYTLPEVLIDWMRKHPETTPTQVIPHTYTDLHHLPPEEQVMVWFGHSSYFMQVDGKKILTDPVFSGSVSPIPHSIRAFPGTNEYQAADMPEIDYLFISHDHWDHLDFKTMQALQNRVKKVICGLGVAQHFEYWGWDRDRIEEHNWYDSILLNATFRVTYTPARHFSGRLFKRNCSLWTSYVLQTPSMRLFLGGDSGYGPHFRQIGSQFGPFDLAILECGQYDEKWAYIHSLPEETVREAQELQAQHFIPVHNSKFKLAQHPWYAPLDRVSEAAAIAEMPILTPIIGQKIDLKNLSQPYPQWWKPLKQA